MNIKQRFDLIARNTQEIIGEKELKDLLKKKSISAYMGYAPTGLLHVGHLVPLFKIADFLKAGINFTFLTADLHAYLDDKKTTWDQLASRAKVYEELIKAAVKSLGVSPTKIKFVTGSKFQLEKKYQLNMLRMSGEVTFARVKRAASEVVRFGDAPKLGGFIYPLMQIEDICALDADLTLSGVDQRGIYMLGRELAPTLNRKKTPAVFGPLLPSLAGGKMGGKMSASSGKKISLLDNEKQIKTKLVSAFCPAKQVKDNGVLALTELVIMPNLRDKKQKLTISRPEKYGGNIEFETYEVLEKAFTAGKLHPADLKTAVATELNNILKPIRTHFKNKRALLKKAYPKL